VSPEAAAGDVRQELARFFDEFKEQELAVHRRGRARETGACAALGIGGERELRDREQAAGNVPERQVHLAVRIGKDAVAGHALGEALGFAFAIAALHADEREHAGADRRYGLAAGDHARLGNALDQRYQARVILNLKQ